MLTLVRHLPLIDTNWFPTTVAILGERGIKTSETVRSAFSHHVPLTPKLPIALKAREVPHMPRPPFRLCAFVGKYDLVASTASRLQRFRVVPATVQLAILPEVYQVDEQLPAYATDEAGRMPEGGWTGATRSHCHLTGRNRPATFAASGAVGPVQLARVSSSKRFAFPLRGEHPKLPLLLLGQPAAVPCLVVVRWELLQQLLHPFPLAGAARVRDLVFR